MPDVFGWLNVDRIGEELADAHPTADPARISFVELAAMVRALPGFAVLPGERAEPNEKILEAIQQAWLDERRDIAADEDD